MSDKAFHRNKYIWLNSICADHIVNSTAFRVAYVIADHLNIKKGNAWPSQARIAERLGLHPKSVQRAVKDLEKRGWLAVTRRRDGLTSNRYAIAQSSAAQDNAAVETTPTNRRIFVPTSGQIRPVRRNGNAPQSYLSKLPKFSLRAGEEKRFPRFTDQGTYEQQVAARLGSDGYEILESLNRQNPSLLEELCRAQRAGFLSEQDLAQARLVAAPLHQIIKSEETE